MPGGTWVPGGTSPQIAEGAQKYTTKCEGTYTFVRNTCFTIGKTLDQTSLNPFLASWQVPTVGCVEPDHRTSKRMCLDTSVAPTSNLGHLVDHLERLASLHKAGDLETIEFTRAKALLLSL